MKLASGSECGGGGARPHRTKVGAAMLLLLMLLAPKLAWASASISGAAGSAEAVTEIDTFSGGPIACTKSDSKDFDLAGSEGPSSVTTMVPMCTNTCTNPSDPSLNGSATVNETTNHVQVSGDVQHVTLTANGSGSISRMRQTGGCDPGFPLSRAGTDGSIRFVITGQPEAVNISVSGNVSPDPENENAISAGLSGPNGAIGQIIIDNNGTTGSIPSGSLPPGSYSITFGVTAKARTVEMPSFSYSLSIDVSVGVTPAQIHWKNPAGGDFGTAGNWDPQQVPTSIDTAIFNLSSLLGLIHVTAQNVGVGNMSIDGMFLELSGFLQVLQGNSGQTGFEVSNGGELLLDNGATLITNDGAVGFGTAVPPSSVTVTGAGTHWTIGMSNPLSIFDMAKVIVDQGGLLNAQKEIDIGNVSTPGTLEVHNNALVTTPLLKVAGVGGTSNLTIDSGGAVQVANGANVGDSTGRSGAVTISGISGDGIHQSKLTMTGTTVGLTVAGDAMTQVEVKDGGFLSVSGLLGIGDRFSVGKVHIHGATGTRGSSAVADSITIGSHVVPSELLIEDGGVVTSGQPMILGQNDGELANVSVASSSLLTIGDVLTVGFLGQGDLTISGGSTIESAGGAVGVSPGLGGNGLGMVTIGSLLPTSESQWHISGDGLVGSNAVGTIELKGTVVNPFANPPAIFGATLKVDGTLTVGPFGTVKGVGKLVTGQRVINGGFISPGFSPGVIEINGNYEQTSDGVLIMEAAGLSAGKFDVLHVTGSATLGGMLKVLFLDNYLPKAGDVLPFLQADGSVAGSFGQIVFPQLLPGFNVKTDVVNGQYQLTAQNDAVLAPTSVLNISTRLGVLTGDDVLIAGFILQGSGTKQVMVRAIGPSLAAAGVSGALADPMLELHDATGASIGQNDNWTVTQVGGVIGSSQVRDIVASTIAPTNSAESAIVATLNPGAYTAIVKGANNSTGVALAEVFDLSAATPVKLANISTRGFVDLGDNVMIGGFIIGNQTTKVIVRAIGPSLPVSNALADPFLELHDSNGTIATNDNWQSDQKQEIIATSIPPSDNRESAIVATLAPGNYTAVVRGVNNTTGVALVEVYNLQ